MNRIDAIYSFIDIKDKVVDIGCDQAKLSILLSKRGRFSIAGDISINVINKAKESINSPLIDLRVTNGLEKIKEGEADTLVLSGMGTHTIIEILSNTKLTFNKIITISNNYHDILRNKMNDLGYIVDTEQIVKEKGKYYNLIVFKQGNKKYTQSEIYLGMNHKDIKMYKEYLEYSLNKCKRIYKESNNSNDKMNLLIELIEKQLTTLNK